MKTKVREEGRDLLDGGAARQGQLGDGDWHDGAVVDGELGRLEICDYSHHPTEQGNRACSDDGEPRDMNQHGQ